jgi:hypothetical protein
MSCEMASENGREEPDIEALLGEAVPLGGDAAKLIRHDRRRSHRCRSTRASGSLQLRSQSSVGEKLHLDAMGRA